jgi:hypothetical protein
MVVALLGPVWGFPPDEDTSSRFTICRLKYKGGGDWYSDPSSLPNLLRAVREHLAIPTTREETVRELADPTLRAFPFLYMTGHGNVQFSGEDIHALRAHLDDGGFLWADDNYGMDESFRREIRKLFPDSGLQPLSADHPIFHCYYDIPTGLPAVHEHDAGIPPQAFGIFRNGRMVVFYSYQSDIGDGLEDPDVHNDPPAVRDSARKMALNIVWYAMTH